MYYYEVAPTTIVRANASVFTYAHTDDLALGTIVTVPVGTKTLTGVVLKKVAKPEYATKPISSIVEPIPLPSELLDTAAWMSEYYQTHLATVLQTILPSGLTKKRRALSPSTLVHSRSRTKNVFTKEQSQAIQQIESAASGTILLHGITGSGKTLVYIESIRKALAAGSSAIVLVPEIALTSQLVAEFTQHFGDVLLAHSQQTEAERHLVWKKALSATAPQVVIGPRSALFLPLQHIGYIVIDECHEPSFKQEQAPRYSALRVASILAQQHKGKVILGSATPNVADFYLAAHSGRPIISMTQPARKDTVRPDTTVIDMTKRNNFTKHAFLSNTLIDALTDTFAAGNQALIFHNRRGTASTTLCEHCGWQAGCPRCFVPLTLHADTHLLRCHICGLTAPVPTSCPVCHHADIIHKGLGTKRIETELQRLFPKQTIARFDGDTATNSGVDKRYDELYNGSIDLIIGTQVIAKGLDLPHLRTVGIVQADAGLSLPDFAAPERTFQLLAQVVGRVGRSHHHTKVVIQTYQPEHPAIQDGASQDYSDFYARTITQRRHTNFPPFCHLLKLTCAYKTEATAIKNSRTLVDILRNNVPKHVQVLGPTPAFYERIRDTYRWQVIVKSPKRQDLIDTLRHIPSAHWQVALDPIYLI